MALFLTPDSRYEDFGMHTFCRWNKVLLFDPTNKIANQLLVTPETLDQELVAAPGDCQLVVYPAVPKESGEGN